MEFVSLGSVVNEDVGTHQVHLRLSGAYPFDITVNYGLNYNIPDGRGGIPTADSDYTALSRRLTVSAGATTATIPVTIIDDNDQEWDETLTLSLVEGGGYRLGLGILDYRLTIHDNEGLPVVSFPSSRSDVAEGAGTHNVTLNLSPAPNRNITLNYTASSLTWPAIGVFSTTVSGSDYEPLSGRLTVLAGATTATIPVTIIDDGAHESKEWLRLTVQGGGGYTTSHRVSEFSNIFIIDDDPQIDVSFASAAQSVVEEAGTRDVTVNLVPAPTADITLGYSVGGTATAGADYTALSGTVAVSGGAATATIPVTILDDSDAEGEETVVLTLTGTEGHRKVNPKTHTLTIAASDGLPTMTSASFATAAQSAGDEAGTRDVTVNLNPAPASNITLNYRVGGTATSSSDYTALSGTVAVSAGAVTATIPVTLLADNVQEDRETVVLTLVAGAGYKLASPGRHTLTFGTVPKVTFANPAGSISESAGTYQVPVRLSPAPPSGITVSYEVYGTAATGTATSGEDYQPLSGTLSVPAGASKVSIPVTIIDDSVEDSGEAVRLRLTDEPGYTVGSEYDYFFLVITNHEPGDLERRVQARLDAAVAGGDGASANLWRRALAAVRDEAPPNGLARLTRADAQTQAAGHAGRGDIELASLWAEIAEVIGSGTTDPPPPASDPEVTIVTDAASVTEGGSASFTLTAIPPPAAPLSVTVTVAASGDYGITAGERTYTIPTTGTYTLTLATVGDDADETDGSVTATVDAGDGYTVGSTSSGTVTIRDDDTPAPVLPAAHPLVKYAPLVKTFYDRITANGHHGDSAAGGWNKRFLKAMGHLEYVDYPQAAVTVADATRLWNHGGPEANTAWDGTVDAVTYAEQYFAGAITPPPTPDPEVTIVAGAGVTEGGDASFTLTADPVPAAPLEVTVTVAASGDYGITAGERTVTIPTTGSYTLTLATDNDGADEADGSVSATVDAGDGYTVGSPSSGTVAIEDDDVPEIEIAAGAGVTEGGDASFTLTADPVPAAALEVTVTVAASGDYGITVGEQTVIIPTTGSYTLTLTTDNDGADEADGSVSVTVDAGDGYTVGSPSSGTVAIEDDDVPEIEIAAGAGVAEGGDASFTLTATPAPAAALSVTVTVAASGDFGITAGERTVTIPTTGSYTLTLATDNDGADEADGSVSVTVDAGDGYTVGSDSSGTVAIRDDDTTARVLPASHPLVKYADLVKTFYDRITARHQHGDSASGGWNKRFLKAMGHPEYVDYPQAAVTVADATRLWNHGGPGANTAWDSTVEAVTYAEQYFSGTTTPPPPPDPEVTIAAGAGVTEGGDATFTLKATPPPAAPLSVTVTIAAEGAFGITAGKQTYAIPTTGSYTLTLATDNDGVDEADGSVSVTVEAGDGYTVGSDSSGTVAIADDDLPPPTPDPVLTVAAGAGVTEGTAASFVLTATPPPAAVLEVTVTVVATRDYGIAAGERTVTIPTTGSYTLTLATVGDDRDEPNGSVTATVNAGAGYTVGATSTGTVAIADDDLPPAAVSVAAKAASITEGGDAVFTVTADRAPDANLAVTLTVTEAAGSDFVAAADEGKKTVTILARKTSATLTVRTEDDKVDEPNGSVTATLAAGNGYTVASSPQDAASVAVADNDAAGGALPVLSVESRSVQEGNRSVILWATIDPFPSKAAFPELYRTTRLKLRTIEGTAWDGVDYVGIPAYFGITEACNFHTTLAPNGKHGCRIDEVAVLDDSHDDGGENFQLEVEFADSEPAPLRRLGAARGTITIENSDPLPAAYLARFGRTVAEQALDGIAGRMSADRTPGMQGRLAGQALNVDAAASGQPAMEATLGSAGTMPADREAALDMAGIARGFRAGESAPPSPGNPADPFGAGFGDSRFGTPSLQSRSMTAREALLGTSFSLTGRKDGAGGSAAFWGRASQGSFDGAERGDGTDITLGGRVTTGMLGTDYARGNWLVGLALTRSSADGSYAAMGGDPCPDTDVDLCDGAVRDGDGKVDASLTAAVPYAALQTSERLKLWGAAGYGIGKVTLKTMDESYSADTNWSMAAAGLRGGLLEAPKEGSGPALALTSDGLWAQTSSDRTRDLAASDSDATRLRLGLEGSYRVALADGGSLVPKLELGARHDGGDAETGFGVEIGGGLKWVDPGLGLSLDVSGRTLLAHENDDLEDRGVSASLAFDPTPATQRGPSFSLRQDFGGRAQGGLDALFAPAPLEDRTGSEAASRWTMEAAWGFPAFGGRFTGSPHVGLGFATGARDYSVGWRLRPEATSAPGLSFGLKATRRENATDAPEHVAGFEATVRW